MIRPGLTIYALFSGMRFKTIAREHWPQLDGLSTRQLKSVFQYYDAQTDDQQLTEHVMAQAIELGTTLETRAVFVNARCDDQACHIQYRKDDQQLSASCRIIINAAGPWANQVLDRISPRPSMLEVDLVLGTHIIVPGQLEQGMYYLESPSDRRAVFVMPWKGHVMIGTTESHFNEPPRQVSAPREDIDYLISVYNHYFTRPISRQDVLETFAGLRVLPKSPGSFFHRSRSTIIHHDNSHKPRVFTLYGGKLTSHRATARQLISQINL
jgi:glycerol-3-phosphate dehydrogenase